MYKNFDNDPNSIFRASRTVKKIINKRLKKDENLAKKAETEQVENIKDRPLPHTVSSNQVADVNKNLSLFTLDIKYLTTLIDSFVDYIKSDYSKIDNDEGPEVLYGLAKKKGRSRSSSFDTPSWANVDSDSGSDSDSDIEGTVENIDFRSTGKKAESGNQDIFLKKELNKISMLVHHAYVLWEDNISENLNYLSKFKMGKFLHSQPVKDFEHSIDRFVKSEFDVYVDYPEISRVYANTKEDLEKLIALINTDINRISGRVQGTSQKQTKPREEDLDSNSDSGSSSDGSGSDSDGSGSEGGELLGAGFLRMPSIYNRQLSDSKTKYLM